MQVKHFAAAQRTRIRVNQRARGAVHVVEVPAVCAHDLMPICHGIEADGTFIADARPATCGAHVRARQIKILWASRGPLQILFHALRHGHVSRDHLARD